MKLTTRLLRDIGITPEQAEICMALTHLGMEDRRELDRKFSHEVIEKAAGLIIVRGGTITLSRMLMKGLNHEIGLD